MGANREGVGSIKGFAHPLGRAWRVLLSRWRKAGLANVYLRDTAKLCEANSPFHMMKRVFAQLIIQTALIVAFSAFGASTRLAIGTLGLKEANRESELADLLAVKLTGDSEMELVERRELDAALKEASLSLAGVVRAKDAVRVGGLLRADKFILGSSATIGGTNRLYIRLVNGRTGVIEAIEVFQDSGSTDKLAGNIADFVRQQRKQASQGRRDFLAIGVVQNLGVNNRFSEFPAQMRGAVAANLSRSATLLERDVVSFLANELRLDLGGLTEGGQTNRMQFAFWIVDGFYQSYEVAEPEVQLRLRVERVGGGQQSMMLQGKPGEAFLTKVCESIGQALNNPVAANQKIAPNVNGEIAALEARGKQLVDYQRPGIASDPGSRIQIRAAHNPDKVMSALDEATRVFESMLLLEPENNRAKMRLAGCLQFKAQNWGGIARDHEKDHTERAREYYREVISSGDPEYANDARIALAESIGRLEGLEMLYTFAAETHDSKEKARFRAHGREMLLWQEYQLPIERIMPHVRKQLIDELTEVNENPKDPLVVSFDTVLFAWRNYPEQREKVLNTLLPEMIQKFPNLKPHILLAAAGEQSTTTNSPITARFLTSLKECEEHPETVWHSRSYFTHLSSTLEDEKAVKQFGGYTLYQRMFESRDYKLVVAVALARQRAAEKGLAPPLTSIGKLRLAESYMALNQWKEALDLFNELPDAPVQAKSECRSHLGMVAQSDALPDSAWKDKHDLEKVQIAYECIGRGQWDTAAAIMESIGYRTVRMASSGAWGHAFTPVLPALVADECRSKAGKPLIKDPMRFEIGEPYIGFSPEGHRHFSTEVEGEDLWMATYSQIKAFRGEGPFAAAKPSELHEFERKSKSAVTSISVNKNYVWAGTYDDGLLEIDRHSGRCRRLTTDDGLFLNGISHLKLQGQTLWIAYRNGDNGAIGTLEVESHKFSALTPNLSPGAGANSQPHYNQALLDDPHQAPHLPITCMTDADPGEMWLIVHNKGLQHFRKAVGDWNTSALPVREANFHDMTADAHQGLLLMANREYDSLSGEKSVSGGLVIHDYRRNRFDRMLIREGLPSNDISAVSVDGRIAWVGCRGSIAVVDLQERKVLRIAYVSASRIYGIRLSPAHAWIALSCDKQGDPDYSGNARTGVYRLARAAIEPQNYTVIR
jgi:hypothetical protein